jgi:hypothetical protein
MNWLQWQANQINSCLDILGFREDCRLAVGIQGADNEHRFIQRNCIDRILPWLRHKNASRYSIFFTPSKMKPSPAGRRKEDFAEQQQVIYLDIDNKHASSAVMIKRLYDTVPFYPSMLVRSSRGNYQAYYVLEEPESWQLLEQASRALCILLDTDHVHDVTHLMRLPGFRNHKPGRNGDIVYIVEKLQVSANPVPNKWFRALAEKASISSGSTAPTILIQQASDPLKNRVDFTKWHEHFSIQIGSRYRSQSEADMAFTHYALEHGMSADTLARYLDEARPGKSPGYGARTVLKALAYRESRNQLKSSDG